MYNDEFEAQPKWPAVTKILGMQVSRDVMKGVVMACAATLAGLLAWQVSSGPAHPRVHMISDVQYSPSTWPEPLRADIARPPIGINHPVVVLVHGGSWITGTRQDMDSWAKGLAANGYVAITIDYRLAPNWHYPAPQDDLGLALRWVKTHATEYGGDPERIGLFGYSAGAQIVAIEGVRRALTVPRISAIATLGLPSEMWKLNDPVEYSYIGADPSANPRLFRHASPAVDVAAGVPAFLLLHGQNDLEVPVEQSITMVKALQAVHDNAHLMVLEGEGHIPSSAGSAEILKNLVDFFDSTLSTTAA